MLVPPSPTPPWMSLPQQYRRPDERRPHVCVRPALTAVQSAWDPATWVGTERSTPVPPSPTWPSRSLPQQYTRPLERRPQTCSPPVLTEVQSWLVPTVVGLSTLPTTGPLPT